MPASQNLTLNALNGLDWLLLLSLLASTLLAFRRGIVRALFSFGGLIAGILLAAWNYVALASLLAPWIASRHIADMLAFLAILIVVTMLATWIAGFLRRTVANAGLGLVDRLFGAMFGGARGLLFGASVVLALTAFGPNLPWVRQSVLAPYFLQGAHAVSFVVPESFQKQFMQGAQRLLQEAQPPLHF